MKRQLFVLVFFIVLSAIALVVILGDPWSTLEDGFEGLVLDSSGKIDKIEVIGPSDTLTIYKSGDTWNFEDGEVLNSLPVESLLYTSANLRVVSIISTDDLVGKHPSTELKFYDGRKLVTSFHFIEVRGRSLVFEDGGSNAFMVELPGYDELSLLKVYTANPDHYRDHLLISLLPSEIYLVRIEPLKGSGFKVEQDSSAAISVKNPDGQEVPVSERKIRLLLSYFAAIRFEEYLLDNQRPPDLDLSIPSAKIEITDFKGRTNRLRIYTWNREGEEAPDLFNALVLFNDNPRLMIVNYAYLELLIRGLEKYIPEE